MTLKTHVYKTIWLLLYITLALCSWFISHMILTKFPHNFIKMFFPSGILSYKYAPGISNFERSLSSCESIINEVNSASSNTIGYSILSILLKYCIYLLPFEHAHPFMVPSLFFFVRFTASSTFYLS